MGAYIGSILGKLGNSYLDERENQDTRKEARDRQARAEALSQQKVAQDALDSQNNFDVMLRRLDEQDKGRVSAEQRAEAERAMRERIEQMRLDAQSSRDANRDKQWQEGQANLDRRLQTSLSASDTRQQRALALQERRLTQGSGPKAGKALPSSIVEKLGAYDALDQMGEEVTAALKNAIANKQDITGRVAGVVKTPTWWKNSAPTSLGGKPVIDDGAGGDTGVDVRSMMGNLYATLAKERGGTALSANEIRLLESYLPNENEDESRAFLKATRFVKELRRLKAAKLASFQKYGYSVDDGLPAGDAMDAALNDVMRP